MVMTGRGRSCGTRWTCASTWTATRTRASCADSPGRLALSRSIWSHHYQFQRMWSPTSVSVYFGEAIWRARALSRSKNDGFALCSTCAGTRIRCAGGGVPLGTYKTVKAGFRPWLSGESPSTLLSCSLVCLLHGTRTRCADGCWKSLSHTHSLALWAPSGGARHATRAWPVPGN